MPKAFKDRNSKNKKCFSYCIHSLYCIVLLVNLNYNLDVARHCNNTSSKCTPRRLSKIATAK